MAKLFERRFQELHTQLSEVSATRHVKPHALGGSPHEYVDGELFLSWCVKARNLLEKSCGEESQHFKAYEKAEKHQGFETNVAVLSRVKAVFLAAKEDYEGGYVSSIRKIVQAEVFDSELEQASELLNAGYSTAAAVVAGAVLETTLCSLCDANKIPHSGLERMNTDLTKAGIHNVLVQKQLTALAAIRNSAAHGKPDEFTKDAVKNMISEITRYVSNALN